MVLPKLDAALRERLATCAPQVAKGEVFWSSAFTALSPIELPYPRNILPLPKSPLRQRLNAPARGSQTAAGFLAWLSALTGHERASVMYCDAALSQRADGLESWLSPWVPLTLVTSPEATRGASGRGRRGPGGQDARGRPLCA